MLTRLEPMLVSLNLAAKASAGVLEALHNHIVRFWTVLPVICVKQLEARISPAIRHFILARC